jgi:hypothetical protein
MAWSPITREALEVEVRLDLAECSAEQIAYFQRVVLDDPVRWQLSPYGDEGGGFWVVARDGRRVLWWNDIEDGWNVSAFDVSGCIPAAEYRANQDSLHLALPRLQSGSSGRTP